MDSIIKNNGRRVALGFLLFTFIFTSTFVRASEGNRRHGKEKRDEIISKMDLTPGQKKEIIETQDIQKDQLGKIRRALRKNRADLAEELKKNKLNFDDIKKIVDEIKDLQGQLIDNRISHFVRMKKILTKKQMNELLDSYKK